MSPSAESSAVAGSAGSAPAARGLVGRWSAHARTFLLVFAGVTTIVAAVPIYLFPVEWADTLGWSIPANTDLIVYYGRGGASFLLIAEFLMLRAAIAGTDLRRGYEVLLLAAGSMVVLHIWGALGAAQPVAETVEILFYGSIFLVGLAFYPAGGDR